MILLISSSLDGHGGKLLISRDRDHSAFDDAGLGTGTPGRLSPSW